MDSKQLGKGNYTYTKDISVIVPVWRGALQYLPKLLSTIPISEMIEVIIVDNSQEQIKADEIVSERAFDLLYADPKRHAGGSRNVGMEAAKGKWLVFADADDYFSDNAFDVFYKYIDTDAEVVYSCMQGVYVDTGEYSDRGDDYTILVNNYLDGRQTETDLRCGFSSPCAKMVSHALVDRENLRYDEIRACNDIYFSAATGYFAKNIEATREVTYIATVNRGSLTKRRDFETISARVYGISHRNWFFKQHGLKKKQKSVMAMFYLARKFSIRQKMALVRILIHFRQNPFIGWKNWGKTYLNRTRKREEKAKKYIVQ